MKIIGEGDIGVSLRFVSTVVTSRWERKILIFVLIDFVLLFVFIRVVFLLVYFGFERASE